MKQESTYLHFPVIRSTTLLILLFSIPFMACAEQRSEGKQADSLIHAFDQLPADSLAKLSQALQSAADLESLDDSLASAYLEKSVKVESFDRTKWKETKKGLNYSEEPDPTPKKEEHSFSSSALFSGPVTKFIFSGIIILLLAFLLFRILAARSGNKKVKKSSDPIRIEDIENPEEISESELDLLLRQALERKDFKEAIRICYLSVIRRLSELNLITWRKNKTNREYLIELNRTNHYSSFKLITQIFDRVWYGEALLNETEYFQLQPSFKLLGEDLLHVSAIDLKQKEVLTKAHSSTNEKNNPTPDLISNEQRENQH